MIITEVVAQSIGWTQGDPTNFTLATQKGNFYAPRQDVVVWIQSTEPYYGTLTGAENYFQTRLNAQAWEFADGRERRASLHMATRAIEVLAFKGHPAVEGQPLFFPRTIDTDPAFHEKNCNCGCLSKVSYSNLTTGCNPFGFPPICPETRPTGTVRVPGAIEVACYEIALCFLNGVDMDIEARNLSVASQGYAGARVAYDRSSIQEHLRAGIPSAYAWSILRPYLADPQVIRMVRSS